MPKIVICHLLASAQCNWSLLANFLPVSTLGRMACGMEHPPGQSGSLVLAILPRWQSLGNCKVLNSGKHCLATTKPSVCYQHYRHSEPKTQHCFVLLRGKLTPSQPKAGHRGVDSTLCPCGGTQLPLGIPVQLSRHCSPHPAAHVAAISES